MIVAAVSDTQVAPDAMPGSPRFVPDEFEVPQSLMGDGFRLEPLGPQHNASDHQAWSSSIDHIRATPGFTAADWDGDTWPYAMPAEANLADLEMHAGEFERREAFAYTVLGTAGAVIGCVYIDPDTTGVADAMVRCWVSAPHAHLDAALADSVAQWLRTEWPFATVRFPGRT